MSGMFDTKTDKLQRKKEASQKELKEKRKKRIITVTVIVVFVLAVAVSILLNSGWLRRTATVVSIDGVNFTTAEFEYFYNSEYLNIANMYEQQGIGFMLPERSRSLSRQMFDAEQTWADMITEGALKRMQDIVAVYNVAKADTGYQMPQEKYDEIDNMLMMHEFEAMMGGYPSLESYLQLVFGTGMNEKVYREVLELVYMAEDYATHIRDSFTYTEEQLNAYYAENADLLDVFKYRAFLINAEYPGEDSEDYDAELEENIAAARETAQSLVSDITDEDSFLTAAFETNIFAYSEPESTLRELQGEQLNNGGLFDYHFSQWLRDAGRAYGDVTAIDMPDGAAVVFFISRDNNDYNTVGMRQLLISREDVSPDEFPDGIIDPEYASALDNAQAEAQARADLVWSLFEGGGATEDALISLREEHSDPDGSEDGLFEDIAMLSYQGYNYVAMRVVPELEEWLFDSGRAIGDSAMIETDYGFHLVYFTGFGDVFSQLMADDRIRTDDIDGWFESLYVADPVKHSAFILVSL